MDTIVPRVGNHSVMQPKLLSALDLGNLIRVLSGVLDRFRFDRDAIELECAEAIDTATKHQQLAEFFARYSIANAKACVAWAPLERSYRPTMAAEILNAIPHKQDPDIALSQVSYLLHWTHGPDGTPYAPEPMRISLITLISAFVERMNDSCSEQLSADFLPGFDTMANAREQVRDLRDHYGECAWIDALWRSQNATSDDNRRFWLKVLDLLGGRRHEGQDLTPGIVAIEFHTHFRRQARDVVARRVCRADIERDHTAFKFWMTVLTRVHRKGNHDTTKETTPGPC